MIVILIAVLGLSPKTPEKKIWGFRDGEIVSRVGLTEGNSVDCAYDEPSSSFDNLVSCPKL